MIEKIISEIKKIIRLLQRYIGRVGIRRKRVVVLPLSSNQLDINGHRVRHKISHKIETKKNERN
jgi:hypothetical protein